MIFKLLSNIQIDTCAKLIETAPFIQLRPPSVEWGTPEGFKLFKNFFNSERALLKVTLNLLVHLEWKVN